MRRNLVVTTTTLLAIVALLPACGSSSKKSAPAETTTTVSSGTTASTATTATTAASGGSGELTCTTFAGKLTLTPPVSPTVSEPHTLTATGTLSGCSGTPGITSGEFTFRAEKTDALNCSQLISYTKPSTASVSVKWNDGTTSVGEKLALTYASVQVSTISGKITSGTAFVGKTSTSKTNNAPDGGGCTTTGVSLSTATISLAPGTSYEIR